MPVKVSVVVPIYNPGRYIDECIASLMRQSLPKSEYEVVFVDDGSTDGTFDRLAALAAHEPNVIARRIPNSGWPGRPRNVGIEASSGRYVYFVDDDDWIGDEALERLYETAERNSADVVIGREVGHGKGVPRHLFRHNVDDATFDNAPLLALLTPHKLFRRSLLDAHGIRFPEGRRRFEDHMFVMRAYFRASRISILGDYPCYHWVKREDWGNATDRYAEPRSYYENLRDVLDVVDEHTEPGDLRNRLYSHWLRWRVLERFRGAAWADEPSTHALGVYAEARRLALERFDDAVADQLPMKFRVRWRALLADRPDLITAQARVEHGMQAEVRMTSSTRTRDQIALALRATFVDADGRPIRFVRDGERTLWAPPAPLGQDGVITDRDRDVTDELAATSVVVVLRFRDAGLEYDVPATVEQVLDDGGTTFDITARADLDLARIAVGSELEPGFWDLFVEVESCGWRSVRRLGDVDHPEGLRHRVAAHTTALGNLSLRVSGEAEREVAARSAPTRPKRRRRLVRVPGFVLRLLPVSVKQAGKRVLLRLRYRA